MIRTKEKTTIGVILDRKLREQLEQVARENERSLGAEVRHLLRRHLERAATTDTKEEHDGTKEG